MKGLNMFSINFIEKGVIQKETWIMKIIRKYCLNHMQAIIAAVHHRFVLFVVGRTMVFPSEWALVSQ